MSRCASRVRDVTLRDGLQDAEPITTEAKHAIFDALVAAGIDDLELTSFVRPDVIPSLADADAFAALTAAAAPAVTRWALVLNARGAQRALAAGLTHLQYVASVSDTHSRRNAGTAAGDALAAGAEVIALAADAGAVVEMTLATAFGCPYEGEMPVADVVARRRARRRDGRDRPVAGGHHRRRHPAGGRPAS